MKALIKDVWLMIKPFLKLEIIALLFTILYAFTVIASPIVSRYLIDEVILSDSVNLLFTGIIVFFAVCCLQPVVGYVKDILFLYIVERITYGVRKKIYKSVVGTKFSFFDKTTKGDILARVLNDSRMASQFISDFFVNIFKNYLLILLIITGMALMSLELTAVILLLFVVFFIVNYKISKKFKGLSLNQQKSYDLLCTNINQMADTIQSIKANLLENENVSGFEDALKVTYKNNIKMMKLNILTNNLSNILVVLSLSLIYGMGSLFVMRGSMTLGTVIALGLYFQLLVQPVYSILNNNVEINKIIPIFERINDYFALEADTGGETHIENKPHEIEIGGLSFNYQPETPVFDGVSMSFPARGIAALTGKSGNGKSTLTKLLLKFYDIEPGMVFFSGKDICGISAESVRKIISYVPQEPLLFNNTVAYNLHLGNREIGADIIEGVCKRLNIHEKIISLNDGYGSVITERVNLSGGEKQRLCIARAVLRDSQILILDEPSSSLDEANEETLRDFLEELSRDKLIIIITHRKTLIKDAVKSYSFGGKSAVELCDGEFLLKSG
jgi:ABC-type multidrug transport system fused ATPase/permease subunit